MEWLEVRIVVQNECVTVTIESRIEALNGDWEPLENERYFASVTSDVTNSSTEVFKEKVRILIHRAQGLHGDWEERVYAMEISAYFSHFLSAASSAISPRPQAVIIFGPPAQSRRHGN